MFATDTCRGGVEHAATAIGHICRHVVDALGTTGRQMSVGHRLHGRRFTLLSLHVVQSASGRLRPPTFLSSPIEGGTKAVCTGNQSATCHIGGKP
jgi:hypothetical protein